PVALTRPPARIQPLSIRFPVRSLGYGRESPTPRFCGRGRSFCRRPLTFAGDYDAYQALDFATAARDFLDPGPDPGPGHAHRARIEKGNHRPLQDLRRATAADRRRGFG